MISKRRALKSAQDWRDVGWKFLDRSREDDAPESDRVLFEASADWAFSESEKFRRLALGSVWTRMRWQG